MPATKLDTAQLFGNFQSELSKMFSSFTPSQRRLLSVTMQPLKLPTFPNLPAGFDYIGLMGNSHVTLARHGWFISIVLTPVETSFSAESCFLSGQIDKGNQMMVGHYRELLDEIQADAQASFPLRRTILKKAFDAHRRKEYELSIPVMLIQADGIGEDIFGKDTSPTSRTTDNIKKRKEFVEGKLDPAAKKTLGAYFLMIVSMLPINAGKKERVEFTSPLLNRHLVLHGIDTDYATEINALKAVSWLQYIVSLK